MIELTGSSSKLVFRPLPSDAQMQRQNDIFLARQRLKREPKIPLREGIRHTIAYCNALLSVAQ